MSSATRATDAPLPTTRGALRESGHVHQSVKAELRLNLLTRLSSGQERFPGIVGLDESDDSSGRYEAASKQGSEEGDSSSRQKKQWIDVTLNVVAAVPPPTDEVEAPSGLLPYCAILLPPASNQYHEERMSMLTNSTPL